MINKKMLLILPLAITLSGCVIVAGDGDWDDNVNTSNWRAEQNKNRSNITKLSLGQSRTEVLANMGEPSFTEAFRDANDVPYQVLYYRTHREHGDGQTTKDETTALVFENDSLVGWGNDALQRIR
jgi:outer membrane protein assembly factor BamE (lipoprotein component of BamABCDE complex)